MYLGAYVSVVTCAPTRSCALNTICPNEKPTRYIQPHPAQGRRRRYPSATARAAGGLPADSTRDESHSQTLAGSKVVSWQHPQPSPGGRSARRQRCLIDGTRVPGRTPAMPRWHAKRAGGYVGAAQRQGHDSGARVPFIGNGMLYATTLPSSCGQARGQSTVDAPILSFVCTPVPTAAQYFRLFKPAAQACRINDGSIWVQSRVQSRLQSRLQPSAV